MAIRKEFLGRGWAFPFHFDPASGRVALSEYEENIRQNISIILGTRPGERQMLPNFGCRVHEFLFAPATQANAQIVARHVRDALERWEPRIEVLKVKSQAEPGGALRIEVEYKITSTSAVQTASQVISNAGNR